MSIEAQCENCGKRYVVPDKFAGRQAECRVCQGIIDVPVPLEDANLIPDEPVRETVPRDEVYGEDDVISEAILLEEFSWGLPSSSPASTTGTSRVGKVSR